MKRRVKLKKQPLWFTDEIHRNISLRNECKDKGDYFNYKKYRNKVKNMIKTSKAKHYKHILHEAKGDSKKCGNISKNYQEFQTYHRKINCIFHEEVEYTDKHDIANLFNDYFAGAADRVLQNIDLSSDFTVSVAFRHFLESKRVKDKSFGISLVTKDDLTKYLNQLDLKKATGVDNISAGVLRGIHTAVTEPLCNIINKSITEGTFPNRQKQAKVLPLHKTGSFANLDNFRPISLLPIASKLMEKHVCEHLYYYFTTNELLCLNQSGFRKNHSCHTCLVNLIEECYKDLNDNNLIGLLALDFRKAFDILNHEVLLKKLSLYGCNKLAVTWFKSYLTNRVQSVKIEDVSSKNCIVEHGVAQGSILGPLFVCNFYQ